MFNRLLQESSKFHSFSHGRYDKYGCSKINGKDGDRTGRNIEEKSILY